MALSRGIQGHAIRIAKALNAMMSRAGKVFADHFHSRLLRSPTLSAADRESLLSRGVSWLLLVGIFRGRPALRC